MSQFDLPDMGAMFQQAFDPVMKSVDGLRGILSDIVAQCEDPQEKKKFEETLKVISFQQAEVQREIPAMVAETTADITSSMERIKKQHARIGELSEQLKDLDRRSKEAPPAPALPTGPSAATKAREHLKAIKDRAPALMNGQPTPLRDGLELRQRLMELVQPAVMNIRPKPLGNIWENWAPGGPPQSDPDNA